MPLHVHRLFLLLLLLAASLPASNSSSCAGRDDAAIVATAFRYVRNFRAPRVKSCRPVRELRLPSRNLTGAVSWAALANLSALTALDLSGNALQGAIPGGFWRAPSLRTLDVSRNQLGGALRVGAPSPRLQSLNVSGNRFTAVEGVEALSELVALDVSANRIRAVPRGLRRLARVRRLDMSANGMQGSFPGDLPPLGGVRSLNVSRNNFSGVVDAGAVNKFGRSAFVQAGNASLVFSDNSTAPRRPRPSPPRGKSNNKDDGGSGRTAEKKRSKKRRRHLSFVAVAVICGVVSLAMLLCLVGCVACGVLRRRKNGGKDDDDEEEDKKPQWGDKDEEEEDAVVAAAKGASTAPVVLFERPLMQLTLADLAAATCGFGRESQLAERGGRSGAAYRAVLPGDLHVVVRVVEGDMAVLGEGDDPAAAFRELARLRHPNILPLLGYCIAGTEKLVLYEYMEKGDLHRWLHELPSGRPDMDDAAGSGDIWEAAEDKRSVSDWPTRHRIALGVARGLAFLHQGWAGAGTGRAALVHVHGHLVPTNVLLGEDLEPRISDFGHGSSSAAAEGDVYCFGVLVLELVTGQAGWDEASVSWARGIIRDGRALDIVDPRVRDEAGAGAGAEAEREMVECLRVGYLCTAHSPDKRPTMQQVVGVLKDIRPAPATPPVVQG